MTERTTAIHRIEQSSIVNLYTVILALTAAVTAAVYVTAGQRQAIMVAIYGFLVIVSSQVSEWYRERHG